MAWTNISAPSVGNPTRLTAFAVAVIDNLTYLYNAFLSLVGSREIIVNGSFESDADSDGYPDGWTRTIYGGGGGSFLHDTSVSAADGLAIHGKRSVKFTTPGGGGSGGGTIETTDYFEITEGRTYVLTWQAKASAAAISVQVFVSYYDCTQTLVSTATVYTSTANPTSWTVQNAGFKPPSTARYAKIKFAVAEIGLSTTAGDVWIDNVQLKTINFENRFIADSPGAGTWTCPAGVWYAQFTVIGAGGGGGGNNGGGSNGGGGGGGGYCEQILAVTPGTAYSYEVGAGGAGGNIGGGSAGAQSQIVIGATTLDANGGSGGEGDGGGGTGGAGGTASGGAINTTGGTGGTSGGAIGGVGGIVTPIGTSAAGSASTTVGVAGQSYGAGGSGAVNAVGGAGHDGAIIFRW